MRLIIFKINKLGDNLVFLPAVQTLQKVLPDAEILLFTDPVAKPLYQGLPLRLSLLPLSRAHKPLGGFPDFLKAVRLCRRFRADQVWVPSDSPSLVNLIANLSGASSVVGPIQSVQRLKPRLTHAYQEPVDRPMAWKAWTLLEESLKALDLDVSLPASPPRPDISHMIEGGASTEDLGLPADYALIHPGGSLPVKRWHFDRYRDLANRLAAFLPVVWIQHDLPAPEALDGRVHLHRPQNLESFTRLLAGAKLFVGNNSGPLHLASALDVPSIILSGPSERFWDPIWATDKIDILRHPNLACLPCDRPSRPAAACANTEHPMACMDYWTVDRVLDLIVQKDPEILTKAPRHKG